MAELKAKVVLKEKGQEASISMKQLLVKLKWSSNVDLDLMAFYKKKDGTNGAVFSNLIPGGSLGSLNDSPYIQLSGDAGVGAHGGDNEEELRITKLDDIAELYIVTLNYTDASRRIESSFDKHDGGIVMIDDKGESVSVPLDSSEKGNIAIIAKIDNTSPIGAKLINENRIVSLDTFKNEIPGGNRLF